MNLRQRPGDQPLLLEERAGGGFEVVAQSVHDVDPTHPAARTSLPATRACEAQHEAAYQMRWLLDQVADHLATCGNQQI